MLILAILVVCITDRNTKQVKATVSPGELTSGYLNSSEIYLHLGEKGDISYDFDVNKEVKESGATYNWYINKKKGNPNSISINTKTGIVTAKEAGISYVSCNIIFSDGTELTSEAKVTVRNNITEVKISNVPENLTIIAGRTYNFNREVINSEAGKGAKTQGITRWEIAEDTASVETVSAQGVIYPMKEGEFMIRAVCFQSTAKYNLWARDKEVYAALLTAASEWSTIKVISSNGTAIASTQEQLNKSLKEESISKITLSTDKELTFMIPEGNYSKKILIVDAAKADVQNHGIFKEVTINAIKDDTWIEFADGNIFYLNDKVVSLIIDKEVNVKRIVIDTPKCTANFEIFGTVGEIIVRQPSEVNFTGNSAQVPVSVEQTAEGSTITTSIPLNLELKAKTDIALYQGAEDSIIDKSESTVVVKIENNTNKSNVITTNNSGGETIRVGETVISDGADTTNPTSTTNPIPPTNTTYAISGITITGNALVGATLTATAAPGAASGNYQWSSSDSLDGTYSAIPGATTSTYVIDSAFAGKFIKATITGSGSYTGSQTSAPTEAIVKPLTISAPTLTLTKTYDGNATATVTAGTLNGVIGTDDVTVSAVASYNSTAVGTGKTITIVYTLSGADAWKYSKPVNYSVTTGEITAEILTITTPILILSKEYDGTAAAAVTAGTLSGVKGADDVTVSAVATYDTVECGTGKFITVVYTLGGADAAKYVKPENDTVAIGEITAAPLTVTTPTLTQIKTYDGNTSAHVTGGTLHGVVVTDDVTLNAVATYNTSGVGTSKTITVVYTLNGADAGNYVKPVDYSITSGTITTTQLTITTPGLSASKAYDGNTTAAVMAGTLTGVVGEEEVTVSAVATYNSSAVGTNKTITVVYSLSGADATNYVKPANYTVTTGTITAAVLAITAPTLTTSKVYDGNTTAVVIPGTLQGIIAFENVTISAVATYNTAALGTGKTITVVYTLGGADAANYVKPINDTVTTGEISAEPLTITAPVLGLTKAYDNTTTTTVTVGTLNGVNGTDDVSVSAVATYDTATVGTGKTITVIYTLSGDDAVKYVKPVNFMVATGVIAPITLTAAAPTVSLTKAYDGNTTASVTPGSLNGVIGTDQVTLNAAATYNSAAAGTGKTITVVYSLTGANAGNYEAPANYTVATGAITAAQLTIAAPALATSKAYNGNTVAAVTAGTLNGVIGSDSVAVNAVATYDSATIGTGKTITVVYSLSGAGAANYSKPADYTAATGEITKAQLTITAPTLTVSKTYDGTTAATVTPGSLQGVVGSETVTVSAVATYQTADAGTGKTITIVYTIDGANAANYVKPVNDTVSNGVITRIQLTITAPDVTTTKVYNGSTSAAVVPGTLQGMIGAEDVTVSAVANYYTADVGTGKSISINYTIGGANAANYSAPVSSTIYTGRITTAQVTLTSITANGSLGLVTTTELILTFNTVPSALSVNNITVTGATKGTLTGTGNTRTLTISNITVVNGEDITVEIASPTGYEFTPASNNVPVNVETHTVSVDGAQFSYIFNSTGITLINYTGTNTEITIGYLEGHKVTEVATNAIMNNSYLNQITIGTDTVIDIDVVIKQDAIYGCDNLEIICLGMNIQARSSSVGPTTTLKTPASAYAGDVMGYVQPGIYSLIGSEWCWIGS